MGRIHLLFVCKCIYTFTTFRKLKTYFSYVLGLKIDLKWHLMMLLRLLIRSSLWFKIPAALPNMQQSKTLAKYNSAIDSYTGRLYFSLFCRIVTFSSVYHLTLHFPKNFGADTTQIYFIGLRGEWSEGHRHGVTICTYESAPSMADHKDKVLETTHMNLWSDNKK